MSVALFFFSCEDESSFLGFKNPNTKFDNYTVEIPLESKVLWLDSVRTSNGFMVNDVNRLLVGKYSDPEFGTVTSSAISQYFWSSSTKLPEDVVLDSVRLLLAFDLYFYGSETPAQQTFTVHQVSDNLGDIRRSNYVNKTVVNLGGEIGSLTRTIDPAAIRELYVPTSNETPQPDTLRIPLSEEFYGPLWAAAQDWAYSNDSSYYKGDEFIQDFRGIAIKPGEENTMLIGFNTASFSQIVFYYHTPTRNYQKLTYKFDTSIGLLSYNNIVPDYSGTALAGITYQNDFTPPGDMRYMQAGTGIATKILMDNFLHFADTVGPNVIINEVQVVIGGVEDNNDAFPPPSGFVLRGLAADNTVRKLPNIRVAGSQDSLLYASFRGLLTRDVQDNQAQSVGIFDSDFGSLIANDNGGVATFLYDKANRVYRGTATTGTPSLFFQQLYRRHQDPLLTSFAIFPLATNGSGPSSLKAVNRAVFPADQIKLRIKYTKPTLAE